MGMAWEKVHQYAVSLKPGAHEGNIYLYCGKKSGWDECNEKERKAERDGKTVINREVKLTVPITNMLVLVDILRNEKGLSYNKDSGFLWSGRQDVGVGELTTEGRNFHFDSNATPVDR